VTVKLARWIDHLPPWISLGAIVSSGVFSPLELTVMAAPLVAASVVEARRWSVVRYRRFLELGALAVLLLQIALRIGLVPTTVNTLFILCGIRLVLPREAPQRRQLLLMGFLLFLVTAIATFEMDFLFWALVWTAGACLVLLHQTWEASSALGRSLARPPPYRQVLGWTAASIVLASLCFLVLPRQTLGLRFFPWGVAGLSGSTAGLSDTVELLDKGPISGNREIVLRVIPAEKLNAERRARYEEAFELLRGITLEGLEGQRWEALWDTPQPPQFLASAFDWERRNAHPSLLGAELFVAPNPFGIIPLPMVGWVGPIPPPGMPLRRGAGGSTRWESPSRRPVPLKILVETEPPPGFVPSPRGARLERLTSTGKDTEAALAWSRRIAPEAMTPAGLSRRLAAELRAYAYTLDNPSGQALNPLQDFLERTRAGHCEYFASALALALRHRGVPARVVNGYRLGPWIEEGGYWLVTQNQAHSWVEYFDSEKRAWRIEDPTPASPAGGIGAETLWAAAQRWTDALRFRWDRHVMRFSDEDQMAGLTWIQTRASALPDWRPTRRIAVMVGCALAFLLALRALIRRFGGRSAPRPPRGPRGILALKPLLRWTEGRFPPAPGETARAWLARLADARPELQGQLRELANETDAVGYGGQKDAHLKHLAKEMARAFDRNG
jgi:hypothetical protein